MKILVTGGCGFIGSNLVRCLVQAKGCEVVNLDKLSYAGRAESLEDLAGDPAYAFEQLDLCDGAALAGIFEAYRPDAIMHLAAESHVDRSINGPEAFLQSNVVGTCRLLEAARSYWQGLPTDGGGPTRSTFRFLHVSTDEVYGALRTGEAGFTERSPYDPHSPYSATKAAADHLVRAWYTTYGLPVLLTNSSNNYGPFQHPEKLIPLVILNCLRGAPIPVYGTGDNIRDWLFVGDHCEALYRVLTEGRVGETYNIGANEERSNRKLVESICALLEGRVPREIGSASSGYRDLITFVEDRPGHDFRYAIDSSKIRRELGWQPRESFDDALAVTIDWYVDHREWCERASN